jgi:hypothetical protein
MTNKLIILGIALLAVGLVALPETLALFAGQHDWYAIDQDGGATTGVYGVPCAKCHADVAQQMAGMVAGGAHKTGTTCEECHIVSVLDTLGAGAVAGNGSIHAATAPACMDCHDGSFTGAPNATGIKFGANEAHKEFITEAEANTLMVGANEACVACHTHVAVKITWDKPTLLSFNATSSNIGDWTVDNFESTGSQVNVTQG